MRNVNLSLLMVAISAPALATILPGPAAAAHYWDRHWAENGGTRGVVYFVDFTGPNYPVGTKVTAWTNAYTAVGAQVNVQYRTSCPNVNHCAYVHEITSSNPAPCAANQLGCAYVPTPDANGHVSDTNLYFHNQTVNAQANPTLARNWIACHEMGHTIGLRHYPTAIQKCMSEFYQSGTLTDPETHDYNSLATLYGHGD